MIIYVDKNLYFEFEPRAHRRIRERIEATAAQKHATQSPTGSAIPIERSTVTNDGALTRAVNGRPIPFKQVRLKGQINPLKPPIHVETVLIGRALGQPTGYISGVGYRVRDDGYVEGEFLHGPEKFKSFEEFERAVRLACETSTKL